MIKQVSTIRAAGASLLFVAVFAAVIAASAAARAQNLRPGGRRTALDEYIAAADDVYKWQVAHRTKNGLLDTTVIELTSQSWRGSDDVGRSVWKHWVTVVRPKAARADTALLYIGGGRNGKSHPTSADKMLTAVAIATNSVVIELKMVPNQPLEFHGDGKGRYEDDLIAYAWGKYLETGEATWLPRLPMVKSAVRAMDCVQEYLAGEEGGGLKVNQFVVAGGSKRGWTTWLTGAVDKRVVAIAPIVIDVLNVKVSMDHHYAAYGFWAPAIGDYVNHKITHRRNHPRYDDLLSIVDPLRYRDRLTIPKCIINATGDE
ncbi:MAG: PhoPQ-activated protein PqaA family protein, partial [Pirellulaceae bacterium]|nr:PhoPQ-activated protein PqaA family protein [Pirellulaceae bacterium]